MSRVFPHAVWAAMALGPLLGGCADAAAAERDRALATFDAFQRALLAGDRAATAALLTRESRAALAQIDWQQVGARAPLQALGATAHDFEHWIRVRDPAQGSAESIFVVTRERGALLVDLVATAAHNATPVPKTGPLRFEDAPLSPAQIDEIRDRAAAALR